VSSTSADGAARLTRPYRALVSALREANAFRSAADLHLGLRSEGQRIGLSTVYRRLHELTERGDVDCVRGADGERLFRLRRGRCSEHTHYLFCRRCGADVEIGEASLERWLTEVGLANGYTGLHHDLVVSGVCPGCSADVDAG
jgi:Fur family transcriptional regulator, ferric uptake regulator